MEDYGLDSHKLIYHPHRVANWITKDGDIFPINLEIGISGVCNHRCIFCYVNHLGYQPTYLDGDLMRQRTREFADLGIKSILYAGNGEPCLNKDFVAIINETKRVGIDVALSTNGVLFTPQVADRCMQDISWIRFSISAGTEETYLKIHRSKEGDWDKVFKNIQYAVELKRKKKLNTVLGIQIVMTPDNDQEVVLLAEKAKKIGVDWFTVKALGFNEWGSNVYEGTFNYGSFYKNQDEIRKKLERLNDERFSAIYRMNRISSHEDERNYDKCYAADFHGCIDSDGKVYPCCNMLGNEKAVMGNINNDSFQKIWQSSNRKIVMNEINGCNLSMCPKDCRLAKMNDYLYELKNPHAHVNFI